MKTLLTALALSLALALASRGTGRAQEPEPTPEAGERTGIVFGQLVNGTPGGAVPTNLVLMLHAWDDAGETVMLDGTADDTGAFQFDDVPMRDGWTFAAMAGYNDVTFFSKFVPVLEGATEIPLAFTVYEKTTDTTAVRVGQLHTFLEFVAGEVTITQVYVLSNGGDRAINGGITLPDGTAATLQFALPAGANNVSFKGNDSTARFVVTADGFADTAPLVPGDGSSQVVVSYSLPYQTGMTIAHALPYPVEGVNVLHRADAGVTVRGPGLDAPAEREMSPGEVYALYAGAAQPAGSSLELTLAGEPKFMTVTEDGLASGTSAPPASASAILVERLALPISGAVFGIALVGAGVWWLRRNRTAGTESETGIDGDMASDDWNDLLRAIAVLDDAHARGEVQDADYAARRSALKAEAQALLQADEAAP